MLELVIEDCLSSLLVSKRLCWCQICRNWIEPNQEGDKRLLLGKIWLQSCHLLPAPGWHYPILLLALPSSIVATTLYYCCHMYYCWHLVLIVLKHYPLYYYFYYYTPSIIVGTTIAIICPFGTTLATLLVLSLLYYTTYSILFKRYIYYCWPHFRYFSCCSTKLSLLLLAQLNPKTNPWVVVTGYKEDKVFNKLTNLEKLSDLEIVRIIKWKSDDFRELY